MPRGPRRSSIAGHHVHTRLTLDRLQHHGRGALPHRRAERLGVVARDGPETGQVRREARVRGHSGGRGQGAHRAAVEGPLQHDDLGLGDAARVCALAHQLDRALVRLGAGVAEERLAAEAGLREALRQPHAALRQVQVGDVRQRAGLLAHGLDHRGVAVPDRADRDPAEEVEVLLSLRVPEPRPLAAHELDRRAPVRGHHPARAPAPGAPTASPRRDLRADAGVREELEQQAVGPGGRR